MRHTVPTAGRPLRLWVSLLGLLLTGCASRYDDLKVFLQGHEHEVAASDYRIEPPDVIEISSPTCPEVDGETQRVGADGKVTLKLLGDVKISDLTPREAGAKLREHLAVYYVDPEVSVRVVGYESKKVFVFGEVGNPGARPFTGRDSVLDVLAGTRLLRTSWGAMVKVIRPGPTEQDRHEIVVDVDRIMQTGDLRQNVLLEEGDIVYVPPTPLAFAGQCIMQVLFPLSAAAETYSTPATILAANDYYRDRGTGRTSIRFNAGGLRP
ncbi:MAG: polysaccharide export protein [Phycisphaerae bacterium]|jgi:protein involved in polysaccharide export with SLBB domain